MLTVNSEYTVKGEHTDIFVHRPSEVRARQFKLADKFLIEELFQIEIHEHDDIPNGDSHYIETLNGRRNLSEGDWIIFTPTGCFYVCREEHFDGIYCKKDNSFTNAVKDNKLNLINILENQEP